MISLNEINSTISSVAIKSEAGDELSIDGSGFLTVKGNGNFTVVATDLDIRSLTSASDSLEIKTAAGQALGIDGSGFITANINGTVAVSSTDLDIRDLTQTDEITAYQGGSWSVNIGTVTSWKATADTVGLTAAELVGTPLAGRTKIEIQNLGTKDIYIGSDNTVTTSNGLKLPKGASYVESLSASVDVFAISGTAGQGVRVGEYAA